jgi:hypothetical protein
MIDQQLVTKLTDQFGLQFKCDRSRRLSMGGPIVGREWVDDSDLAFCQYLTEQAAGRSGEEERDNGLEC